MGLTEWIEALKWMGSKQSKRALSEKIKANCLRSQYLSLGKYLIDDDRVWEYLVLQDKNCLKFIEENNIKNCIDIESQFFTYRETIGHRYGKHIYSRYHHKR